jgi:hypothetical protein
MAIELNVAGTSTIMLPMLTKYVNHAFRVRLSQALVGTLSSAPDNNLLALLGGSYVLQPLQIASSTPAHNPVTAGLLYIGLPHNQLS